MSLTVHRCGGCSRFYFEASPACFHCGADLKEAEAADRGTVYSFTRVHAGPEGTQVPYLLALVEMKGLGRVMGRLSGTGPDSPAVGAEVRFSGFWEKTPVFEMADPAKGNFSEAGERASK